MGKFLFLFILRTCFLFSEFCTEISVTVWSVNNSWRDCHVFSFIQSPFFGLFPNYFRTPLKKPGNNKIIKHGSFVRITECFYTQFLTDYSFQSLYWVFMMRCRIFKVHLIKKYKILKLHLQKQIVKQSSAYFLKQNVQTIRNNPYFVIHQNWKRSNIVKIRSFGKKISSG